MSRARFFYTVLVGLIAPLAALYLLWRSRKQPDYRRHWGERFGWARYPRFDRPLIWLHAVSVGETRAAQPLVAALLSAWPDHHILLTHMTPTGRETGAAIVKSYPGQVSQCYLPYDLPFAVRRFLRAVSPRVGIVMETEVWPNLLAIARQQGVPMVLANARLSEKSLAKALRTPHLMREAAQNFSLVLAQTAGDAERLIASGASAVEVLGNVKFDFTPDAAQLERGHAWRKAIARPVWLFASTREGEEALILAALQRKMESDPDLSASDVSHIKTGSDSIFWGARPLFLIVPRHPQRFDEVADLLAGSGWPVLRRSQLSDWPDALMTQRGPTLVLGDSMGEMALYDALADVALMGGSLLPYGSHNVIEPAAIGTPLVLGPSVYNFAQAAADALAAGAAVQVADAGAGLAAMAAIGADAAKRRLMSEAGRSFAAAHRGATARTIARISPLLAIQQNSP
ncbi:MAG: lipid IV(A) 3-deoxy-D-manno-octulosonic acid transferase [Burkholderiaceae bacterium]